MALDEHMTGEGNHQMELRRKPQENSLMHEKEAAVTQVDYYQGQDMELETDAGVHCLPAMANWHIEEELQDALLTMAHIPFQHLDLSPAPSLCTVSPSLSPELSLVLWLEIQPGRRNFLQYRWRFGRQSLLPNPPLEENSGQLALDHTGVHRGQGGPYLPHHCGRMVLTPLVAAHDDHNSHMMCLQILSN